MSEILPTIASITRVRILASFDGEKKIKNLPLRSQLDLHLHCPYMHKAPSINALRFLQAKHEDRFGSLKKIPRDNNTLMMILLSYHSARG